MALLDAGTNALNLLVSQVERHIVNYILNTDNLSFQFRNFSGWKLSQWSYYIHFENILKFFTYCVSTWTTCSFLWSFLFCLYAYL